MKNQAPFFIFVIMNNDFYILIIGFITAFVSVNTIIYFYLKYKRKIFFNYIKSRNYALVEKVETTIEAYSKISTKLQYRKSDIVFLDKEIFILHTIGLLYISEQLQKYFQVFSKVLQTIPK